MSPTELLLALGVSSASAKELVPHRSHCVCRYQSPKSVGLRQEFFDELNGAVAANPELAQYQGRATVDITPSDALEIFLKVRRLLTCVHCACEFVAGARNLKDPLTEQKSFDPIQN